MKIELPTGLLPVRCRVSRLQAFGESDSDVFARVGILASISRLQNALRDRFREEFLIELIMRMLP